MSEEKTQYNKVEQAEVVVEEKPVTEEKEKLDQVTQVKTRKKGIFERLVVGFIDTDGEGTSLGQYLFKDIVGPALKDLSAQALKAGVDRLFYRDGAGYQGGRHEPTGRPVSYHQRYQESRNPVRVHSERPNVPRQREKIQVFDFEDRVSATVVLDTLKQQIDVYGYATVSDYYDLVGETTSYTHLKYGWYDLRSARISNSRRGFTIYLPEPEVVA